MDIINELKGLRRMPSIQSLTEVNEHMGFPLEQGGIIFFPFFIKEKNDFFLSSELFIEKASFRIVKFYRLPKPQRMDISAEEVSEFKNRALQRNMIFETDELPNGLKELYYKAAKEIADDKY